MGPDPTGPSPALSTPGHHFPLTSPVHSAGNFHQSSVITQGPNLWIDCPLHEHTTGWEKKWDPWTPLWTKLDCQYGPQTLEMKRKTMGQKINAAMPEQWLLLVNEHSIDRRLLCCLFRKASSLLIAVSECNLSLVLARLSSPSSLPIMWLL